MSKTTNDTTTLEQRIATALDGTNTPSSHFALLIAATTAAIADADKAAEAARTRALDPSLSPDPRAARTAMEDAEFAAARLRVLLPRLEIKHTEAAEREYLTQWQANFARFKGKRDNLAMEGKELPEAFAKIANYFDRCAKLDVELSRLHLARPAGVAGYLLGAELTARGLAAFDATNPSIASVLKLPDFTNSARMVWPPPTPSIASFMAPPTPSVGTDADWWKTRDQRAREAAADTTRTRDYYDREQARREARQG